MKIKLNLWERLTLSNTLPKQGSFIVNNALDKLSKKLIPDLKEAKSLGHTIESGKELFNIKKASVEKPFEIDELCFNTIRDNLRQIEKSNQLQRGPQTSLFEKFNKELSKDLLKSQS